MLHLLISEYNRRKQMMKNKKVFFWDENTDKVDLTGYTHIRAYHGCRTSNVESYIKEGCIVHPDPDPGLLCDAVASSTATRVFCVGNNSHLEIISPGVGI